jgi:fumarate hydratase class II
MTEHSPAPAETFRTEHDSMGEVLVPAAALWGAQTQRARAHAVSGEQMPREVIVALARIKSAAAAVNAELGIIDAEMALAIQEAAGEITVAEAASGGPGRSGPGGSGPGGSGPLWPDVFQTGSGTFPTNMNANEV